MAAAATATGATMTRERGKGSLLRGRGRGRGTVAPFVPLSSSAAAAAEKEDDITVEEALCGDETLSAFSERDAANWKITRCGAAVLAVSSPSYHSWKTTTTEGTGTSVLEKAWRASATWNYGCANRTRLGHG